MAMEAVDLSDAARTGCINDLVFTTTGEERQSWKFCNSIRIPRSEVAFFSQIIIIFMIIVVSLYKLCYEELSCEEKPIWVSILSSAVGYLLPNPQL